MSEKGEQARVSALIGLLLIGLGVLFLVGQVLHINLWAFFWPFFIIIPGLLFFVGMVMGGKPAGPLAIPGSIVTMTGLLLLYQSITGHWESWAYAWALIFPTAVGIGLLINGVWSGVGKLVESGKRWITAGVTILVIGGVFFELLIFREGFGRLVWPGILIALGLYLLVRRSREAPPAEVPRPPEAPARPITPPQEPDNTPQFEPLDLNRGKK